MTTLDYSNLVVPVIRPALGRIAAWGSLCYSIGLTIWLIPTAQTYFIWNHDSCGTPAARVHQWFFLISPFLIAVPIAGVLMARFSHFGVRLARGSCLASLAAWAVTAAFIHWGWMLEP